ncbi:integrase, catalytic region, zinc finger, CCHC-type containing protein, partial [Tanacetum coccineum]
MISRPTSSKLKDKVEVQPRSVKSNSNKKNYVAESDCNADVKHTILNSNSELIYAKYNQCMSKKKQTWKPTGKVFTDIGYRWKPTGRTITIVGNSCPFTRLTSTEVEPLKETTLKLVTTSNLEIKIYRRKSKVAKLVDLNSELSTVRFGNDQIAKIMGYGDYQMGNVTISRVYYVEGLGHNLFSVGKFCDSDLEVAFRKHTCYIRDLGVDLLKGSRGSNLYTLSLEDIMSSLPICLLSKASKTKSWLWHRRLSHLNFDSITALAKQGLVVRSDPERGRSYDYLQARVKHIERVRSIDVATQASIATGGASPLVVWALKIGLNALYLVSINPGKRFWITKSFSS